MKEASARTLLLVDDDQALCAMLAEYLGAEGFLMHTAHDGAAGVEALRETGADLVILDITMPVLNGFDALREIRRFSNVPVLMLTARGDELDRIVGLELGADDYLSKPFNPRELAARLRAILRRSLEGATATGAVLAAGDLQLDPGARTLLCSGATVSLTATEFAVLEILMRSAGQLVAKDKLSVEGLGRRLTPFDRSLDTHISNLRRKLGPGTGDLPRIRTLRGRGYLLVTEGQEP
jgi:two-component system response regulator CpxR